MSDEKSRVAMTSVVAAIFLVALKLIVGVSTGSLGILSEALHSGLDLLASIITLFAVKISAKPADKDHNYGHGKFENLSALIQAGLLLLTCAWIVYEAVSRLSTGDTEITVGVAGFAVIIISIVVDIGRSRALRRAAKKHNSQALEADALHFSTDILSSSVVLIGLVFAAFGYYSADSIAALGVAAIVIWVSVRLTKRAANALLDKAPDGLREEVREIIKSVDGVKRIHNLRVRASGAEYTVSVNIHVDSALSIVKAHKISENVEKAIEKKFGGAIITVHIEPDKSHIAPPPIV